jgi:hypothetical protein
VAYLVRLQIFLIKIFYLTQFMVEADASKTKATDVLSKPKSGDIFVKLKGESWVCISEKEKLDSIAATLSSLLSKSETKSISFVDFGGVAEHFLGGRDTEYLKDPPKIKATASNPSFIYSFVPTNKKFKHIHDMADSAEASGFAGTVILTKKHGSTGKATILAAVSKATTASLIYYEDTAAVLDELKADESSTNSVGKFWVRPPADSKFYDSIPKEDTNAKYLTIEEFLKTILAE